MFRLPFTFDTINGTSVITADVETPIGECLHTTLLQKQRNTHDLFKEKGYNHVNKMRTTSSMSIPITAYYN